MQEQDDIYPTRTGDKQQLFPRLDPTIHSRHQERWNGPLGEDTLSRFERDGFLWFKGFFSEERVQPFFDELREMAEDASLDEPRPEFLATRENIQPLSMNDEDFSPLQAHKNLSVQA